MHCWAKPSLMTYCEEYKTQNIYQANAFQNIICKMLVSLIPAWIYSKYNKGQAFSLCCNWPDIRSILDLWYTFYHLSFEEHVSVQLLTGIVHHPVNVPWWSIVMSDGRLPWMRCGPGPCLNIRTIFPRYGDSHVKDETVARLSYL